MTNWYWPTAAAVITLVVAIACIFLFGPSLGIDDRVIDGLIWAFGLIGVPLVGAMRSFLGRDSDGDGKPDWMDRTPTGRGPRDALVALLVAGGVVLGAGALQACGGGQQALSAQATVHRAHREARTDYYDDLDAECGTQHETRDAYRECMRPARRIGQAADSYRHTLEAAQAVLDAAGRESFEAMVPDLVRVATELIDALVAGGVPVPALVRQVASLGGAS
ncbi:MAG: hypothetical protein RLP09_35000 [Sandaracinaceae bacterium]